MAIETRGIFTLKELTNDLLKGEGVTYLDVFLQRPDVSNTNFGYFGGGNSPGGNHSNVDKINFATDAMARVPTADLPSVNQGLTAGSSNTHSYFSGGQVSGPTRISNTNKTSYSDDTTAAAPGANLTQGRSHLAATGTVDKGYFGGGFPGSGRASTVDKITFANDTAVRVTSADFPTVRQGPSAAGNNSQGYFAGGFPGSGTTPTVNKLVYSSETSSNLPNNLAAAVYGSMGVGDDTFGYIMGGSPGTSQTITNRITYSDDTVQRIPGADLPLGRARAGTSGDQTAGYISGGATPSPNPVSSAYKLTYADETVSLLPSASDNSLASVGYNAGTSARQNAFPGSQTFPVQQFTSGLQEGPNTGYNCAGYDSAASQEIQKVDMDTDTLTVTSATTSTAKYTPGGSSSTTAGYIAGGTESGGPTSTMDKLTYASDSSSRAPGADLSAATYGTCGSGNQSFGYFSGGYVPPNRSSTDKLTYSSDTVARIPSADMLENRRAQTALCDGGTTFMGGSGGPVLSNFEKLSFGSETCSTMPGTSFLTGTRYLFGPVGNKTDGYIAGGFPSSGGSLFQKLNYSSETLSMVPGNLYASTYGISAFGNLSFGYFSGGGVALSNSGKMTYATETFADNPGTYLPTGRRYQTGVSSRRDNRVQAPLPTPTSQTVLAPSSTQIGYMSGGITPSGGVLYLSTIYKLNMSDESVALVPGQNTSGGSGKVIHTSTGNSDAGYYSGGLQPGTQSATDKNTYSTETVARVPALDLPEAGYGQAGVSITTNGFLMGSSHTGTSSSVQKITFASDSIAISSPAQMPRNSRYLQALGTTTAGYGMMGEDTSIPAYYSNGIKLTYSSETSATIPLADVPTHTYSILQSAVISGNSTAGYFQLPGNPVAAASQIVKFTYSNDTSALAPSAELVQESYGSAGMGDGSTAGYILGGRINSTSPSTAGSYVQKLTFSNDTASNIPATLSQTIQRASAISAADFGLPGSKTPAPVVC